MQINLYMLYNVLKIAEVTYSVFRYIREGSLEALDLKVLSDDYSHVRKAFLETHDTQNNS